MNTIHHTCEIGAGAHRWVLGIILWALKRDLFYQPLFPRSRMNCHTLFFYFNCPWCSKVTVRFTLMCAWIASCPVTPKQLIYFFVSPHCVYSGYIALCTCLSSVFHNVAHHITYSLCSEWLIIGCLLWSGTNVLAELYKENMLKQEQKDSLNRKISDTLKSGPLSLFPLNHWDLRALQNNWHSTSLTQPHM